MLVGVLVHPASVQDRDGARALIEAAAARRWRVKKVWADAGYAGSLGEWARERWGWVMDIVRRRDGAVGFEVQHWRWIVERTLGWISRHRRLAKDYERKPETTTGFMYVAMIGLMIRRLVV
jgi:transposase